MRTYSTTLSILCEMVNGAATFGMCDDDGVMLLNWQQTTDPAVVIARALAPHITNVDCDDATLVHLASVPALHRKLWRRHECSELTIIGN